jgi:hypothetical protein
VATSYKNAKLAGSGAIGTFATLYTTGAATAVISSLVVVNSGATARLYRIGLMGSAGTPAAASGECLAWDVTIAANDVVAIDIGISLSAGQFIRCSSDSADVNFHAFIAEIT